MNLAASQWLWSGLALAVPIVVHLLGRGRGVRKIWPSVRLLRETGLSSGARWRPSQPWLLLVRCALMGAVTMALAEPVRAPSPRAGTVWLVEAGAKGVGSEVRYLAPGLPAVRPPGSATPDLWSLLAEADAVFPPGLDFKVMARPRLGGLRGTRPALGREVAWYAYAPGATAGGEKRGDAPNPPAPGNARPLRLRLLIAAAPERAADAAALRAGLVGGARALGWTVGETVDAPTTDSSDPKGGAAGGPVHDQAGAPANARRGMPAAELLASLGQEPPAGWAARVERGATLLRDEAGEVQACASLVATRCCGGFERWQCGGDPSGQAVWRDGSGRTALAHSASGAGAILRFAGRFGPVGADWSRGAFAALLRDGFGDPFAATAETSVAQALPERRPAAGGAAGRGEKNLAAAEPMAAIFWLLAGGCFAAERGLVWRAAEARRRG